MKNTALIQMMVVGIVFVVALLGYWYFLIQTNNLQKELHAVAAEVVRTTKAHEEAGSVRTALSALEAEEALLRSHFVSPEGIVSYLESVESLGTDFGAKVTVLSVTDPGEGGKITLSLSVSGSFDAVMRTIGILENGTHASAVRTLTLDGGEGLWNAAVSVIVLSPPSS